MGERGPAPIFIKNPETPGDETPEWQRCVDKVLSLKEKGHTEEEIIKRAKYDVNLVKRILEDEKISESRFRRMYKQKIPNMEAVRTAGIKILAKCLEEIEMDDRYRRRLIKTPKDISLLMGVVEKMNMLMRLELDKSTQNLAVSNRIEHAQRSVAALKDIDKVFSLPEPEVSQVTPEPVNVKPDDNF